MAAIGRAVLMGTSAIVCVATVSPALAQNKSFDIPAQSLDSAVRALARQGDVQIIAAHRMTRGRKSSAVRGVMNVEQALRRMLAGTGLVAQRTDARTYTVGETPEGARRETIAAVPGDALTARSADGQDAATDAIVVTGTRASLESAERNKRDADIIMDGISADDIGQLPDVSIADALVRIPGLNANEQNGNYAEASIRGLGPDLVTATYNGRILPTLAAGNRRASLGTLPTEGVSQANVQKTASASAVEGGLAGVVDLQSIRPLETKRRGLTVVMRGIIDDNAQKAHGFYGVQQFGFRPEITLVKRLAPNLGIALSYALISRPNIQPTTQLDTYNVGSTTRMDVDKNGVRELYPTNASFAFNYGNQNRHSLIATLQWDPVSSLRVTVDALYANAHGSNGPIRFIANGPPNGALGLPTSITITNDTVTQFQGNVNRYTLVYNGGSFHQTQLQTGINLAFDDGGPFRMKFDASYANAQVQSHAKQATVENDATTAATQVLPFGYDARDPKNISFNLQPLAPEDYALSQILLSLGGQSDQIISLRHDLSYDLDIPFIKSLQAGVRFEGRDKTNDPHSRQYSFANLGARPDLDSSYLLSRDNPIAGVSSLLGGPSAGTIPLFDLDRLLGLANAPGAIVNEQYGASINNYFKIRENSFAAYAQANLRQGGLSGNIGIRYIMTDESVAGRVGTTPANTFAQTIKGTYDFFLPSLNLRYAITRNLIARFAAGKTMSRPIFDDMKIGSAIDLTSVTGGVVNISRGNPYLKPFTSKNLDATLEWYVNKHTVLGVEGFYKWVTNFTVNQVVAGTIALPDGTISPSLTSTTVNDPTVRRFKGIELIARRDLNFLPGPFQYLGVSANWTHSETDASDTYGSFQGASVKLKPNNFTGDTINAQFFYSHAGVDFRLAYRNYTKSTRQALNGYIETPGGIFDLSGGFNMTPQLRLTATWNNIFKAKSYVYFVDARDNADSIFRNAQYFGSAVTVGLRARL